MAVVNVKDESVLMTGLLFRIVEVVVVWLFRMNLNINAQKGWVTLIPEKLTWLSTKVTTHELRFVTREVHP